MLSFANYFILQETRSSIKNIPFFILQLLEATIPVIQRYFLEFAYPDLTLMKIQFVCGLGKVQAQKENADLAGTDRKCLRSDHWRGIGCDNLRRTVPIHGAHTTHDCTYSCGVIYCHLTVYSVSSV